MGRGRWFPIWDTGGLDRARAHAANKGLPLWHVYDLEDDKRLVAYYVGTELPDSFKARKRYMARRKG